MAHNSFMKEVLEAVKKIAAETGGKATVGDVSVAMFAKTRLEHKRVLNMLSQLSQSGRIVRISQGMYRPASESGMTLEKREVMKNVLNIRKRVTVADLMEMAGVSRDYAREWLRLMTRNGVLRKEQAPGLPATWYRIREIVGAQDDTAKAGRLREIRTQKKQIADRLDAIGREMGEIRTILNGMGREDGR